MRIGFTWVVQCHYSANSTNSANGANSTHSANGANSAHSANSTNANMSNYIIPH